MNPPSTTPATPANVESTLHDLFALTDEQILEIEPQEEVASGDLPAQAGSRVASQKAPGHTGQPAPSNQMEDAARASSTSHESPVTSHAEAEPPQWVAEAMNDPQRGREARALWEGSQKAQKEAAAYREVFAKPEEARAAGERARVLDEIDRAYFGATGNSAEQTSAARAQLAQMMMRENPAAFREMVFAGLRALEKANGAPPLRTASSEADIQASQKDAGLATRSGQVPPGVTTAPDAQQAEHAAALARYAAFEKAANEDLERSVGSAIERTLEHALPNTGRADDGPMKGRLAATIRQDVEKALQGDRQLGEQVAQILSARRLDNETRAQVVRLIGERAEQLVPGAAKRALNDWTQTTLAAHRSRTRQNDSAASRSDLAPANGDATNPPPRSGNASRTSDQNKSGGNRSSKVDYRKLSDEQILNL